MARRGPKCDAVARFLPAYVAGEQELDPSTLAHVAECLRCQAEIARYRRMLRALHSLRLDREPTPTGLLGSILADLEEQPRAGRLWLLAASLGPAVGVVAATAALVWLGRRRGPAPA